MYDKVFQMGSFPLNLHQNMSYGKILTCQVFSDRRSPRGESPPGLDQIDRVKLANCGLPSAVQAETSIDIILSYVQHDNHLAMLRRTPVTQAAVQRLNSMGWREGASLEASLMFVGMMIITFL